MQFTQAAQAPIAIEVKDNKTSEVDHLSLPLFTLDDFVAWGASVDAERRKAATEGLDPVDTFKLLTIYPIMPVDLNELRNWIIAPAGIKRVLTVTFRKIGKIPTIISKDAAGKEIKKDDYTWLNEFINSAGMTKCKILANMIAGFSDFQEDNKPPADTDGDIVGGTLADEKGSDPFTQPPAE